MQLKTHIKYSPILLNFWIVCSESLRRVVIESDACNTITKLSLKLHEKYKKIVAFDNPLFKTCNFNYLTILLQLETYNVYFNSISAD